MKNKLILTTVVSIFALSGFANAQAVVGSGTMGVTADVVGTIALQFITDGSGLPVTGTTTPSASLAFGTVQMYGATAVTHLTQTVTAITSFKIPPPSDFRADPPNSSSHTFPLAATPATADAIHPWTVGTADISSGP